MAGPGEEGDSRTSRGPHRHRVTVEPEPESLSTAVSGRRYRRGAAPSPTAPGRATAVTTVGRRGSKLPVTNGTASARPSTTLSPGHRESAAVTPGAALSGNRSRQSRRAATDPGGSTHDAQRPGGGAGPGDRTGRVHRVRSSTDSDN
eukprot:360767-Hanusia_phi.AAC.1